MIGEVACDNKYGNNIYGEEDEYSVAKKLTLIIFIQLFNN